MVHALQEVRSALKGGGTLINIRPELKPVVVELMVDRRPEWSTTVDACGAPDDLAAAEASMDHAVSEGWFTFERTFKFTLDVLCDTADDLKSYAQSRKLTAIPYQSLEALQSERMRQGTSTRLRLRRPWMLSVYVRSEATHPAITALA